LGWGGTKSERLHPEDAFVFIRRASDAHDQKTRKASEGPLFAKSSAWEPPYQAWQERAKSTRELAGLVRDGQAKNLLILIAETYGRLAHPL
jgi:hypothetical protein